MSEMIVEFAGPLLSRLPAGSGADEWRHELMIASIVWNGVLAEIPRAKLVAELAQCVRALDVGALVDELVARKHEERFASDSRFVMGLDTYEAGNRVHVTALSAR
jgi:hypothetical protein